MRIPTATYRLQLNHLFGFKKAKEINAYLADLGVSDIYASPIFKARRGSLHGYDIVDPNQLNPELGEYKDFEELISELKKYGLFWLQDIVPNHMAYDSENLMLMDVLENGRDSAYFNFFDIDWEHYYESMRGRVLAPLLGKFYAEALENGEIKLAYDEKGLSISYYDLKFPLRIESYIDFLEHNINLLKQELTTNNYDFIKLLGAINLFKSLAAQEGDTAQSEQVRHTKSMLWVLYNSNTVIKQYIEDNLVFFNGKPGESSSFDALDKLIMRQLFRLSFWKVAAEEINYRRFFTVNELISLKVEDEAVFNQVHDLIFKFVDQGLFSALRVDHIDGLRDPAVYLHRLREKAKETFVAVEKILAPGERLPEQWPIQGTTGYDFMNLVNGLFCKQDNKRAFTKIYRSFADIQDSYEVIIHNKRRLIISKHLAGNIDNLAHLMKKISAKDRYGRDITLYGLKRALVEVMVTFPVYRTYINQESFSEQDSQYIREAIEKARKQLPEFLYEFDFIEKFLLLKYDSSLNQEDKKQWIDFVMNFQQYTGPLMAKGFEDTVLYIYNRLISLNEVGGSPDRFGFSIKEFHDFNAQKAVSGDFSFNATSTHDTKRGEDARARINVLSEIPGEWEANLKNWVKINKKKKTKINGGLAPDSNDEYFIYQALLGVYPFSGREEDFVNRIKAYIIKAVREAKRHTTWIKPDTAYEEVCTSFIENILEDPEQNEFIKSFLPFQKKLSFYGIFNSLSQTLLKICSPGVADFYQGAELWDLNLVDPDNRRPVDFEERKTFLSEIKAKEEDLPGLIKDLFAHKEDGRIKLFTIYRLLKARNTFRELFQDGEYIPLEAEGKYKENIIAFARQNHNACCIVVAPRFLSKIAEENELPLGESVWQDTIISLPDGFPSEWESILTGQKLAGGRILNIGNVLDIFLVSLLIAKNKKI